MARLPDHPLHELLDKVNIRVGLPLKADYLDAKLGTSHRKPLDTVR